jgi:hypothetical protein
MSPVEVSLHGSIAAARTFQDILLAENTELAERFDVLTEVELAAVVFINERKDRVTKLGILLINTFVELGAVDRPAFAGGKLCGTSARPPR